MTRLFAGMIALTAVLAGCGAGATAEPVEAKPESRTVATAPSEEPAVEETTPAEFAPSEPESESSGGSRGSAWPVDCAGKTAQPLDATWKLSSSGGERVFDVHVPAKYDPARRTPVVFDFHGFTSDEKQQALLSGLNAKADEAGFVAVHARGTGVPLSWNAGACCGQAAGQGGEPVDDVRFVRDMLDRLESQLCVDEKRVYATGMSNGGFLSHRLACEMSDRIAAIAPVAGVLGLQACAPSRHVPVMHFHGTLDTLVPYRGEPMKGFPSVASTINAWAERNGCSSAKVETFRKVDTVCETHQGCADGATVTLCTVQGGGHTWPGGLPVPPLGHTTSNLSATDAMWDFFAAHPMR